MKGVEFLMNDYLKTTANIVKTTKLFDNTNFLIFFSLFIIHLCIDAILTKIPSHFLRENLYSLSMGSNNLITSAPIMQSSIEIIEDVKGDSFSPVM